MGPDRQGVSIRDRRGERLAGRPLQRPVAASRLPLHVRARLHRRVSVLLGDRGRVRPFRHPPGQSRRHAFCRVAGAAREAAGVQGEDGVDVSRASSFGGDFNFDFNVSVTEKQQRAGTVEYNYQPSRPRVYAKPEAAAEKPPDGAAKGAAMTGTDLATYARERPRMSASLSRTASSTHLFHLCARTGRPMGRVPVVDRAKGRNETGYWWHRHDEYNKG